jgi:hypothetical protein
VEFAVGNCGSRQKKFQKIARQEMPGYPGHSVLSRKEGNAFGRGLAAIAEQYNALQAHSDCKRLHR